MSALPTSPSSSRASSSAPRSSAVGSSSLPVIAVVAAGVRAALGLGVPDLTPFLRTLVTLIAGSVASLAFARVERKELEEIKRQASALVL